MRINIKGIGLFILAFVMLGGNAFTKKKGKDKKENVSTTVEGNTVKSLTREALFINAMQSKVLGNFNEAILRFSAIVKDDPNNYEANFQLAQLYYEMGLYDKAENACEKALAKSPNNEWVLIFLGQIQYEKGEVSKAVETYKKLSQIKPNEVSIYLDYASLLIENKQEKEAVEVYGLMEKKFGTKEDIVLEKMLLLSKMGLFDKNIEEAQKLIQTDSNEFRYYGYLGDAYEEKGLNDKAIETYRKVLQMSPGNASAYLSIINIYNKLKDDDKKESVLFEIIQSKDIDVNDKLKLIIPTIQDNIFGEVIVNEDLTEKIINSLIEVHPDNSDVLLFSADLYYNVKKEDKALAIIEKGLADTLISEDDAIDYFSLLLKMNKNEYIVQQASIFLKRYPENPVFDYLEGISSFLLKNYEQTKKSYQAGLQKNILNENLKMQMLIGLGDVSSELKDFELADKSYESALEIDPNNALVLNNYAYFLSVRNIELDYAEKMSKKSNLIEPDNAAYQDTYAWIFYQKGDYNEALNWMEKALKSAGENPSYDMLHHMGDVLLKLGKHEKAISYWEQSLKLESKQDGLPEKIAKYKKD